MNIALFSPSKNPYSETFVQAHKNYLNDNVFYYYGLLGNVSLENSKSLVSQTTKYIYRLKRMLSNSPYAYVNKKAILKSLKKNKVDVILIEYGTHAHHLIDLLRDSKLPYVVHFHGYDASVKSVIDQCDNYQQVFQLAANVIVVSRKMEETLLQLGCAKVKLKYNPCGPSSEYEKIEPKFTKKQFIAIGRFTDKKAPYYTILAFKNVADKFPQSKLILAGDGLLINTCENLVKYLGLEEQVEFLGVINASEYKILLKESLAFVQHSVRAKNGDMEGTPVAVLEASVAGLPVISTIHAGIPDVIKHGKTGLLCDEHDVNEMSRHMLALLEDIDLAKRMGQAGKEYVKTNFSMDRHIRELQNILLQASEND